MSHSWETSTFPRKAIDALCLGIYQSPEVIRLAAVMSVPSKSEQEQLWAAVDQYAESVVGKHQPNELRTALETASKMAKDNDLPPAEVSPLQGMFLATQCRLIDAKNVLEVGTLGGYSTIWLASSGPDVHVTSIEIDPKHQEVAAAALAHAGLANRVDIKLGPAVDVLPSIREEVSSGSRDPFDLVFIDADKQNNVAYFHEALQMCRSRACIIVDNVVRGGAVVDPEAAETDARVRGTREVLEAVGVDHRILDATVVQTVGFKGYDGFLMAVVK